MTCYEGNSLEANTRNKHTQNTDTADSQVSTQKNHGSELRVATAHMVEAIAYSVVGHQIYKSHTSCWV